MVSSSGVGASRANQLDSFRADSTRALFLRSHQIRSDATRPDPTRLEPIRSHSKPLETKPRKPPPNTIARSPLSTPGFCITRSYGPRCRCIFQHSHSIRWPQRQATDAQSVLMGILGVIYPQAPRFNEESCGGSILWLVGRNQRV